VVGTRARETVRLHLDARLALLGLGAFAIRLVYILAIARAPVGVGGDAGFYHSAANLIAHGHFYDREIFGHAYKTAEHPPLFSLALSVSSVFGGDSLLAHRIVSIAIGSCSVVLVALLGRRVGGDTVSWLAGAIAAIYPPLVTADGLVMSEPLFVLLVTAALLLALTVTDRPTVLGSASLGAVVGLAILTRGEGVLLLPLLAWPAAFARDSRRPGRGVRLLATTAAALVVVSPWLIRNAVVFHRFILAADSSTVIAGANCRDTYYGHDIGWWSNACLERARTRAQLLEGDASTGAAVSFARKWVDIAGLALYFPLLVLAVLGALRLRTRRWILLAPVWMVLIVSITGWGIGRFRVAADVSIIVLAAYWLVVRSRRTTTRASPAR
jgi:4-amino-4-deoxy-L-arabinose transferase-like glycosyltransferase